MSRPVRHALAVTLLALAGLVIAVALGILVSRTASQSVALGGADLGSRTTLVVTPTTPAKAPATRPRTTATTTARTTPSTTVTPPPATTFVPVPVTPTTSTSTSPKTPSTDDHRGSTEHSGRHEGDD